MADTSHDDDWFWAHEWQAGERQASAQMAAGEGERYDSYDELRAALDAIDAQRPQRQ
jgi:hypothetical protein